MGNGRGFTPRLRSNDLAELSSEPARRDTTALLIGMMFKQATGSNEMMQETMGAIDGDVERLQAMIGTLLNLLVQYVTISGTAPGRLKELVDHLCETLNIGPPEE